MNIFLFLKPKSEVAYLYEDDSIRQALEKMEHYRYASVPIINKEGKYVGSISEGDLLWHIKDALNLNIKGAEDISIETVKRYRYTRPMDAECEMEDLIAKVREQNFVPIVDSNGVFIGIVTRKDVIDYMYNKAKDLL